MPELQDAAEAAVRDGLRRLGVKGLQAALVAIDPSNGNLLAMVGGSDFAVTPYNRATRARRQPGSAFKPFVYSVALESGMSPASTISGLRQVAIAAPAGVWIPRDERASEHDALSLREALLESSNAAAVLLQQRVGSRPVLRLANDLGVRDQPDVPSLALGSGQVTPLDLTAAYAVFPNLGYRVKPRGLVSVENASGDGVDPDATSRRDQILTPQVAFQMVTMLEDVVDRGTGAAARRLGVRGAIGGKTGTTNDYRDAWFVGFNSAVVVGVWVGFDQPERIRVGGTGAQRGAADLGRLHATHGRPLAGSRVPAPRRSTHRRAVPSLISASGRWMPDLCGVFQGRRRGSLAAVYFARRQPQATSPASGRGCAGLDRPGTARTLPTVESRSGSRRPLSAS